MTRALIAVPDAVHGLGGSILERFFAALSLLWIFLTDVAMHRDDS